jgi:hypothetical protein
MGHRGTEVVEGVLRHHTGACFAALERRLLDLLHEIAPRLTASEDVRTNSLPRPQQQARPLVEVRACLWVIPPGFLAR